MIRDMSLEELAMALDNELTQAILSTSPKHEIPIVKEYLERIQKASKNVTFRVHTSSKKVYYLNIRTKLVHGGRPYALFSNGPCGKKKVELGDILFVVKYLYPPFVAKYHYPLLPIEQMRVSFLQAKLTSSNAWKITAHQQEFLTNARKYKFRFGKKWDSQSHERKIDSKSDWIFTYLLMSTRNLPNLTANPKIVELWRQNPCADYSFHVDFFVPSALFSQKVPLFAGLVWDGKFVGGGYSLWSYKFLRKDGIGGYIINNGKTSNPELEDLVRAIYRFAKLTPDPPGEFDEYTGEGAFGVVEFTFAPSEEVMKLYKESRENM